MFERFTRLYPTPRDLASAHTDGLLREIGSLGLRWRAPLMIRMAGKVSERGAPPDDFTALCDLPGVGPYAAAAFLSMHRGVRATIVDANVVRWLGRVFGFKTDAETRRKKWLIQLADDLTPRRAFRAYNYAVLDLSMQVCAAKPRCLECPLGRGLCDHSMLRRAAHPR